MAREAEKEAEPKTTGADDGRAEGEVGMPAEAASKSVELGAESGAEAAGTPDAGGSTSASAASEAPAKISVLGHEMNRADLFKFVGLIVFFALIVTVVLVMWPYIADVFSEGGVDRLVERVRNAGVGGVFILLGMQLLQIIVAFIPGEVVQLAAGLMYGPWLGTAVVLLGCVISSAIVYKLVHVLGAPFVQSMVSTEHLEKFQKFEDSGKLDIIVFVLFLIPAMPKDVFTYLVPLTHMKMGRFLLLSTIGRIPGVLASTYIAHGLSQGEMVGPIVIVAVIAVVAIVGVVFREKILNAFARVKK